MANWDRQYRMRAGVDGATGFEIGEPDEYGRAIHISFSVERSDSSTLNSTKIKVWNLNKSQIGTLMTTGCEIQLMAGYGTSRPVIFKGTVSNVNESLDGADRLIEIEAVDGFADLSETVVSVSYSAKTSTYKVFVDIANKLGLPVAYSASAKGILEKSYFSSGYSYVGYAQYVLDDISAVTSLTWSIQNGVLQIRKESEGVSTYVHLLNKETGLINIPKRVYSSSVSSTDYDTVSDTLYGYEVEYLMDGSIGVGDKVQIESEIVKGVFMVTTLTIEGDNVEGNWQCTAEVTEATV